MSFIQQFFTSRDNNANAETFVGQQGRLWWDPVTNQIYSSDGSTPGGIPLAGGGNGTPGGSNGQVQFNRSGSFGGSANLTFDSTTGALTAVSFAGDGLNLSNIAGANITGTVANATYATAAGSANTANTVTVNAQPNITSLGTLSTLSVSGNVDAAYFIGNGSQLTGITGSSGNRIVNGTSNVEIATADGNATITTAGASTWTFDTVGNLNLPGGNIVQAVDNDLNIVVQDADNDDFALQMIVDDGAGTTLSRIQQKRGEINLGVGLATGSPKYWEFVNAGTLRLPGDIWGAYGSSLTVQIPGSDNNSFISLQTRDNTDTLKSNINVGTANVTISTNTVGNTWVFDNTGKFTAPGNISTTGNIIGAYLYGDGSNITGLPGGLYGNSNVSNYLASGTNASNIVTLGNVSGNYVLGNGSALASLTGANVTGTVANATYATNAGTVITAAQPNITSVGTLSSLTVTSNVSGGNILTNGQISASGNINGASLCATGNILSTGNIIANIGYGYISGNIAYTRGLDNYSGNVAGGNIETTGLICATGNITGGNIKTNGLISATGNVTGGNLRTTGAVSVSGGIIAAGEIYSATDVTGGNVRGAIMIATGNITGGNILTNGFISAAGNVTGNYHIGNGSTLTSITGANVTGTVANATYASSAGSAGTANTAQYVTANAQANITSVGTLTSLSVSGNTQGGNFLTNGLISATGNSTVLSGTFRNGDGQTNYTTPQITFGYNGTADYPQWIHTRHSAGVTYNNAIDFYTNDGAQNAAFTANAILGLTVNQGRVGVANPTPAYELDVTGTANITGNVIANNFVGNGYALTSLTGANVTGTVANATYAISAGSATTAATVTANAQPNITSVGILTSVNSSGNISAAGNVTGGNLLTTGIVSAAGTITSAANITGSNILTSGLISSAGNVNAINLISTGTVSATSNVTGGNLLTNGLISSAGNIIGGNLLLSYGIVSASGMIYDPANMLLTIGGPGPANVRIDGFGGVYAGIGRVISATGNVTGGNLLTGGLISAIGNITTITGISATGNISGGNLLTGGLISATGNISGGNVIATTTVYANAITAFVAGPAANSGVALQMPQEGALRNLNNGSTNMYFDVSTGGSTNGQFQFRSSSSFTNVLTMSPTAFNVNTEAVVTAKTASFGRLPWNSAIDTELTIDNYRFRVSNQAGIFPQIISNTGGSVNSAWTAVAARSGSAINQTGSTGTLVSNGSWTSLYTSAGMDSSGDTIVVTLQDKGAGRIYRVTFMRSDNGSTTGYNIIAERLI